MAPLRKYDDGQNVLIRFHHLEAQTEKAWKVALNSGPGAMWIPKSQIAHLDKGKHEMWIPLWLAEKNGLAYQ